MASTISLRCTYCHDALARRAARYCAACLAPHHADCQAEHGACAAPGCDETATVRPGSVGVTRLRRAPSSGSRLKRVEVLAWREPPTTRLMAALLVANVVVALLVGYGAGLLASTEAEPRELARAETPVPGPTPETTEADPCADDPRATPPEPWRHVCRVPRCLHTPPVSAPLPPPSSTTTSFRTVCYTGCWTRLPPARVHLVHVSTDDRLVPLALDEQEKLLVDPAEDGAHVALLRRDGTAETVLFAPPGRVDVALPGVDGVRVASLRMVVEVTRRAPHRLSRRVARPDELRAASSLRAALLREGTSAWTR